ncbi:LPXTG cell wall anchor domain-containing protein [Neobacillus sp. PS3-40]|uniref:LPXTG cell wall anchor domain-containing protein n=1 Tax=Neobacillus sp. PS3-40 TaxID=3070679 RepID=UPI0027E1928A|nr:LPXTG cell wall anchor domain-containing protein [Neobacillus sp. PS3-40]WML43039.1 LPXTG cell wall anchor domain-containing protein [Neobacillus sp. PS3-40]
MKRDVAVIPFGDDEIIIACDNSGAIGMKPLDAVPASYEMVAYYSFRVAWMECVAAGAVPFSVVIQNFCGNNAWPLLMVGVKKGMKELGINELPITGSTETNFTLMQSVVGMTVLGKRRKKEEQSITDANQLKVAIIGRPLVGSEVIDQKDEIAPLELFQWFCEQEEVMAVLPVGSKGVLVELELLFAEQSLCVNSEIDMRKSSGPSTCFIVVYKQAINEKIEKKSGVWFHVVNIRNMKDCPN